MAISFLGGGNQEYPEKATYTHCKSNYKRKVVSSALCHVGD